MPSNHKQFELTILGCSGGPISGSTCSYLLKPSNISYSQILSSEDPQIAKNCLLAIDAGSGLSAISDLIEVDQLTSLGDNYLIALYDKQLSGYHERNYYQNLSNLEITCPFKEITNTNSTALQLAWKLLNANSAYLITHSHLDHIAGLVVNSPSFDKTKTIYALPYTIDAIQNYLFNGSIWPDMIAAKVIKLNSLTPYQTKAALNHYYDVTCFPVAHGSLGSDGLFLSSAFLITDRRTQDNLLVFGDVESDVSSGSNYNGYIWDLIAPLLIEDTLGTILIECSSFDKPPPLYGHMTPTLLIDEFLLLRKICLDKQIEGHPSYLANATLYIDSCLQPLKDLNVIIVHVKETAEAVNPRTPIIDKLNELNERYKLGINFTIALPGLSYMV